jgi:hypothetical protein
MGLGLTLQELEDWKGHYALVLRWHERVRKTANGERSVDELDFILTFFLYCFHFRDWLIRSNASSPEELADLFKANSELRLCRDIANSFKHMTLSDPSIDARFSIVNEYVPKNALGTYRYPNGKWTICAHNKKELHQFGLVELADRCIAIWQRFLVSKALLP